MLGCILIERYSQQREKRRTIINYLINLLLLLFYRLNNRVTLDAVLGKKKMITIIYNNKGTNRDVPLSFTIQQSVAKTTR